MFIKEIVIITKTNYLFLIIEVVLRTKQLKTLQIKFVKFIRFKYCYKLNLKKYYNLANSCESLIDNNKIFLQVFKISILTSLRFSKFSNGEKKVPFRLKNNKLIRFDAF